MVGDAVVAVSRFCNSRDKTAPGVEKGLRGIVQGVDSCGNYRVQWEPMSDANPAFIQKAIRRNKEIHRLSDNEVRLVCDE